MPPNQVLATLAEGGVHLSVIQRTFRAGALAKLAELTREDLAAELGGWGLRAAADLVDETLEEAAVAIGRETPVAGAFTGLQESLAVATDRLRSARSPAARRSKSQAGSIWTK